MQNTGNIAAKIILVMALSWLVIPFTHGQKINLNEYEGLYSSGEIPKVVIKTIEKRIQEGEKKHINKNDNWFVKKAKERSIIERSFVISELLLSGNVLFNDTLSGYIKQIAKELLKNDLETYNKLHFFIIKSPYVNTLSTEEGIILINTGLIARTHNEAELAFLIAREIAHFRLKHHAKLYINSNLDNKGTYNLKLVRENILKHSGFSVTQETQADSLAIEMFNKANYTGSALKDILNIFSQENQAIEQFPFDIKFFNSNNFKIPDTYFFTQVNPLQQENQNQALAIGQRNQNINFTINSSSNYYLLNEATFDYCRDISRFELSDQYLKNRQYSLAIYNSYILLKKYPNNQFLKANIANCLYFLAKYKNINNLLQVNDHYENVQGEQQQLFLLFSVIKQEELNVMAIQYLWKTYNDFPNRTDLKKKANELMIEMFKTTSLQLHSDYFYKHNAPLDSNTNKPLSEKGKMQINRYYGFGRRPADTSNINLHYAFAEFFPQNEFNEIYNNALRSKETPMTYSSKYYSAELQYYNPPADKPMQLNKIVMVDPTYYKINNTFFVEKFNALESEKARKEYSKSIKDISKKARLDIELLDSKFLNTKQVSLFNDIYRLNSFINELYIHRDLDSVLSVDYQLINLLLEKHHTKYLAWNNVFALTEPDAMSDPVNFVMYSFYLPVLIPIFLYDAVTPDYYTYHYMTVADIEKGKVIFNKSYLMIGKDTPDRLKSNLYYNFLQLGGAKKK